MAHAAHPPLPPPPPPKQSQLLPSPSAPPPTPAPPHTHTAPAFSCVAEAACVALRTLVDQAHARAFTRQLQARDDNKGLAERNEVSDGVAAGSCEGDCKLLITLQVCKCYSATALQCYMNCYSVAVKLFITLQELQATVGDDACARILSALETDAPDAIALRRTSASGRWINFHTDTAERTVQVRQGVCETCDV
jgi:hypothetical protein